MTTCHSAEGWPSWCSDRSVKTDLFTIFSLGPWDSQYAPLWTHKDQNPFFPFPRVNNNLLICSVRNKKKKFHIVFPSSLKYILKWYMMLLLSFILRLLKTLVYSSVQHCNHGDTGKQPWSPYGYSCLFNLTLCHVLSGEVVLTKTLEYSTHRHWTDNI